MNFLKREKWLGYAFLASLLWGFWGIVSKVISNSVSPVMNHVLFSAGMLITLPFVLKNTRKADFNLKGFFWSMVAGMFAIAGNLSIYFAFDKGAKAAVAIPITGLYPMVTILIAFFMLKEKINRYQIFGVLLAIPSIILLSGEHMIFTAPSLFFENIETNLWFVYCMITLLCWGIFSALQKLASNYISASWCYVGFILISVVVSVLFLSTGMVVNNLTERLFGLGILAGVLNGIGVLFSFLAYAANGKAGIVTVIISVLQPIFTILPAIFILNEKMNPLTFLGILLAIIGAVFISFEKKLKTENTV
jgi:drug/metabolite transporter (DMT)-like permease